MNDLKEAISVLPATADLGRITKGAAQALLGRIALYNENGRMPLVHIKELWK